MFIKSSSGVSSHPKLHTYEEGYLLPVLTSDELLFSSRHKGLLRQIRDLTAEFSQEDYDRSYGLLIKNFIEFAQVLPHKTSGIMGSLLNYSLARASAVFQKYCQLRKGQTTPLLKFAVFSAALLKDVGRVISNQRVVFTDEAGEFYRDWNPLSGSMVGQSQYYKMYPISAMYLRIESEVTPLLARQLIPHELFLWLSSDLSIFADWLAALLDEEGVGSKEITWSLAIIKREDIIAILNTLDGALVDMQVPEATEHGEAFYKWLKEGIEKGDIAVNTDDAHVQVVHEGVLIEKQLFKQFVELCKLTVNYLIVYQQFGNLMGVVEKGPNDHLFKQLFNKFVTSQTTFTGGLAQKSNTSHEGILISDAGKIFITKEVPTITSLKSTAQISTSAHHQLPPVSENLTIRVDHTNRI